MKEDPLRVGLPYVAPGPRIAASFLQALVRCRGGVVSGCRWCVAVLFVGLWFVVVVVWLAGVVGV